MTDRSKERGKGRKPAGAGRSTPKKGAVSKQPARKTAKRDDAAEAAAPLLRRPLAPVPEKRPRAPRPERSQPAAEPAAIAILSRDEMALLLDSGLFDPDWYRRRYRDVAEAGADPAEHYRQSGEQEGRWPNAHFDPAFYRQSQLAGTADPAHLVLHYVEEGERRGLRPISYFDPVWYRERYLGSFDDINALGHYLLSRGSGRYDPNFAFDTEYYLRENPDVAASGADAFEHFLDKGWREGRNPSPHFDVGYYQRRYLHGMDLNPLVHYVEIGARLGNNPDPNAEPSPATEVRKFSRQAKEFEEFQPEIAAHRERLAKLIAFYLPQFHPFPENDEWWGTGFTEWTNLSRGNPRFEGHYQPRVPRDFGFYDLRDPSVMPRQIEAARAAGLHGWCFYYYNFNGKRLLHGPVEEFLERRELDWPFCILWANENWSRRWDGSEAEILIRQDYRSDDAEALIDDFARHFKDPRYIRVGGRPLFFVYRAGIIPNPKETIALWRKLLAERHGEDPLFFLAQTFTDHDPKTFGLDGAVEFPPHKILSNVHPANPKFEFFDHGFSGLVYRYDDVVEASLGVPTPDFPLIKTVFPTWDNDARRQGRGVTMAESTPRKYQAWLEQVIGIARRHPIEDEPIVFINAWNEWAEGAYLEPDIHYGWAYLNATARAVVGQRADGADYPVLIFTADWGDRAIRQQIVDLSRIFARRFGCEVHVIKLDNAPSPRELGDFASIATATKPDELDAAVAARTRNGRPVALVFGTAAGNAVRVLKRHVIRSVAIVSELPIAIRARTDAERARIIARDADVVAAASNSVLAAFERAFGPVEGAAEIFPPADRLPPAREPGIKAKALKALGLPPKTRLVVNAGPASLQSGVDLFAAVARIVTARRDDVAFVWVGDIRNDFRAWLEAGVPEGRLQFRADAGTDAGIFAIADVVAATSREDADGAAVLEAAAADVPVVAFEGSGAGAEIASGRPGSRLVPFGDVGAMADQVAELLANDVGIAARPTPIRRREPVTVEKRAMALLQAADPNLRSITAVVIVGEDEPPGLRPRLLSVFDQSLPVFEVVVLGDRVTARTRALVDATLRESRREARIVERGIGASLPDALAAAAAEAGSELLWAMPAGGRAEQGLLARLADAFVEPDTVAAWALPVKAGPGVRRVPTGFLTRGELVEGLAAAGDADDLGAVLLRRDRLQSVLSGLREGTELALGEIVARMAGTDGKVFVTHDPLSVPPPRPAETERRPATRRGRKTG